MEKKKLLLDLFVTFIKIGGFTVGGGYAMIPVIQHELVDVKKWLTEEEMADCLVVSQSLPGVIGINTATYSGKKTAGFLGSVCATLGMVLPSLVIICVIAYAFSWFQSLVLIQRAFSGVRAAVVSLIFVAAIRMIGTTVKNGFQIFVFLCTAAAIIFFGVPAQYMILFGALAGIFQRYVTKLLKERGTIDD